MINTKKNLKTVYVGVAADIVHKGHINIFKIAKKYGKVIVGLLTDKAISSYKNFPYLSYEQRKIVIENIKFVDQVVPQDTLDYVDNLKKYKPDYVVHGDDWKKGIQSKTRQRAIQTLKKWSGKLIEPKYTENISSSLIKKKINKIISIPNNRVSILQRLIKAKNIVRILESHSALTGLIIENLSINKKGKNYEFDGMWSSSLTDSATKGKPDNQSLDYSARISSLSEIIDRTSKPVLFDADNGGRIEHLPFLVRSLERLGVSAIVIEDKIGLKKNSLFKNQKGVSQDSIQSFCKKIKKIKEKRYSNDFLITARIESFILNNGLKDALRRANAYSKAGADLILIHSKSDTPKEIFKFAKIFSKSKNYKPLVAVPSTYSKTHEKELIKNNFKIVIYANHLLRSSYPAMVDSAKKILLSGRSFEIEKKIIPIKEIINLIEND